ncbi:MAG: ABC transporter permease, partial [Gammaproteobacteria bacterium]
FWGAPLIARELEHGTHRLVWTQSVTRRRWVVSKLSIIGGSALAFSAILAVLVNWWSEPLAKTGWDRFGPGIFDLRGFVPIAYTMFAVALGAAIGTLTRKTLPALFATLAVFGAVRIAVILFLREHYMAAKRVVYAFNADAPARARGDWILSQETVDGAGKVVSEFGGLNYEYISRFCPDAVGAGGFPDKGAIIDCAQNGGLRTVELYHPADRFWTFQAIEAAIFVALTALLVVFIVRRVRRLS